ncbi:DedA family protein [Paractinoplanes rishiriensis]|uniref:VTT domain-containing protein n=1 Tax=Paractinoplanes rishiriensis TaxID=1050105 RepID=A0A919N1A8_9ACTN|nr:VTT domain-containing protein [Actinoplanes rishiriensis]GIF00971.1 hypothetical protein Ari01nite_84350 [Actinoplanes rishiriensis]
MSFLDGLPPAVVLLVVGVLVTAEVAVVAGLVLPAATALIAMGLLANAGTVPIAAAVPVAVVAALLGGQIAYRAGRRRGAAARTSKLGRWIGERRWERAERLFDRHGGRAVFLGQWLVGARTLVPRLAGMNGVPYRRFVTRHTPAAVLWAVWMVGVSYLAGACYDLVVARAGRAGAALLIFAAVVAALVLTGRWLGRLPGTLLDRRPVADLALSLAVLTALGTLLVLVIPVVVRFSGLGEADVAIASWAQGEWTSDGYLAALETALFADPAVLVGVAAAVSLARWWWRRRRGVEAGLLTALGPVLPVVLLAGVIAATTTPDWHYWQAPSSVAFPALTEYAGHIPFEAVGPVAAKAAEHTAQLTAAVALLAWLLAGRGPRWWRVGVWSVAGTYVAVSAGCWVYLGWSRTSETVAAVLIGAAWAVLNAAIWSIPPDAGRRRGVRLALPAVRPLAPGFSSPG